MSSKPATQDNTDVEKNAGVESDQRHTMTQNGHHPRSFQQANQDIETDPQRTPQAKTSAAGAKNPANHSKISFRARSRRKGWSTSSLQSTGSTSRALSSGQARKAPVSASPDPGDEAAQDHQKELDEFDERLYNILQENQSNPDSLRALFVREDSLKFVRSEAMTEFYDFFNLQACNIVHLRKTLVDLSDKIFRSGRASKNDMARVRIALHQYYKAIRDIEFTFSKKPATQPRPQQSKSSPEIARIVLPKPQDGTGGTEPDAAGIQRSVDLGVFNDEVKAQLAALFDSKQKVLRFVLAAVGGVALIGPMIIMTLHPGRNTSLVTTSVAVSLVTAGLTFVSVDPESVILYSAAYAAVLVVFIGGSLKIDD